MRGTLFLDPLKTATYYYDRKDSLESREIKFEGADSINHQIEINFEKGPRGAKRVHFEHSLLHDSVTTRLICWLCLRRLQEPVREKEREKMLAKLSKSSEKSLPQIWRIRTLCLSAKKFGLVQITANLFARFCTKPNVFFCAVCGSMSPVWLFGRCLWLQSSSCCSSP